MIADMLPKSLERIKIAKRRAALGVVDVEALLATDKTAIVTQGAQDLQEVR